MTAISCKLPGWLVDRPRIPPHEHHYLTLYLRLLSVHRRQRLGRGSVSNQEIFPISELIAGSLQVVFTQGKLSDENFEGSFPGRLGMMRRNFRREI